ncbi:hypothetical protein AJ88_34960 [Mesorhizobium amorphae CCBAU 01583]|nr:hypothetical protein AJ88_34960 [Mesorhizobium amorphae CCBAU 01583]
MEARRIGHGATDDISRFLESLARSGYRGDIARDIATRTVFATDNSIYQVVPVAVLIRARKTTSIASLPLQLQAILGASAFGAWRRNRH